MSSTGRKPGRPPIELTQELQDRIVGHIRRAAPGEVAAQSEGVGRATFYGWKKKGRAEPSSVHGRFLDAVSKAESDWERSAIEDIATKPDKWQAVAWLLERRRPERYGRMKPYELKLAKLEIETLKAKLALLQQGHDPDQPIQVVLPDFKKPNNAE